MATTKLDKDPKDPAYRRFVPDQVLTAAQLNDVIDHFECQDRFTRICLNGVGIVCGLEVKYSENTSIEVTKGCAVTTDGDLIPFPGATYTLTKVFDDVEANYGHFNGVNLIELLPAEDADKSGVAPLAEVANLNTMVVVLYLEYFCKEETPCTSTDCDSQGQGQTAKLRMLLIPKEDVKRISNKNHDPIFDTHNNTAKYIDLPSVNLKKVILKNSYINNGNGDQVISQNSNTASLFRLRESYRLAMQGSVIDDLKKGINKLFTDFDVLLDTDSLETKATTINNKITALFKITPRALPLDIQYRYGLLKDLIDTYNEIKCLLFDLRVVCCPDISSFPKHLLLAELEPVADFIECRHSFYPSPIIPHGQKKLNEIRSLILRMHFMLSEYNTPLSTLVPIKVTPSKSDCNDLGERALPYYYATSPNLVKHWDYEKTRKFKADKNLGYQSANLSESDAIQNPLDYDVDDYDFYRIEGHLGKDYRDAIKDIDAIKTEKGLAIDIKVLSIDETIESINTDDYECEFEDLNAVLKAWRAEQNCLNAGVSKFFSGFSLKDQGKHKFYRLSKFEAVASERNIGGMAVPESPASTSGIVASAEPPVSAGISTRINPRSADLTRAFLGSRTGLSASDLKLDTKIIEASFKKVFGQKLHYNVDTVVLDNLEKDEDVLGSVVDKAMREKPEGSAEDIVSLVRGKIDKDSEIANWDKNNREVTVYNASEILSYVKVASRYIPNNVAEISKDRINIYEKTIKDLCARVEQFKKNMTTLLYNQKSDETAYKRMGHEQQYALLLNQLSVNCCSAAKMKSLLAEIELRKKKILEQKLLSKFVEKHPGLEHKAGVKPGGTFVLVYIGGNSSRDVTLDEATISRDALTAARLGGKDRLFTTDTFAKSGVGFNSEITGGTNTWNVDSRISGHLKNTNLFNLSNLALFANKFTRPPALNITANTVVADFALPYICCSDCSPIAFIVPKTSISLRLPADFVCLDEDTKPLTFEVEPSDGVVTADVADGQNGGVTQIDNKYVFDAKLVSEALYGTEIKFKVNDQFTDSKITVFEKPDFGFVASEPTFFKENRIASINFTVNGELPSGVAYQWDFGDGSLPDNITEENPKHFYNLDLGDDGSQTFTVSLTVTNGKCSHSVEHDVVIAPVIITFEIPAEVCLEVESQTETLVPFKVSPEGATVELLKPVEGAVIKENNLVFVPGFKAFNEPIGFVVNGEKVKETCTPRVSPEVQIVLPSEDKLVINPASTQLIVPFEIENLNDFDESAQKFHWNFGDGGRGSGPKTRHTYTAPRDAQNGDVLSFEVTLEVSSKFCESRTFKTKVNILVRRIIIQ